MILPFPSDIGVIGFGVIMDAIISYWLKSLDPEIPITKMPPREAWKKKNEMKIKMKKQWNEKMRNKYRWDYYIIGHILSIIKIILRIRNSRVDP